MESGGGGGVWAVWGGVDRSPSGACCVMFRSVTTFEAHTADAGASQHTNNTVELSGFVEALQFILPQEPAPRGARACIFFESQDAADVCFGSIQPWSDVCLVCRQCWKRV